MKYEMHGKYKMKYFKECASLCAKNSGKTERNMFQCINFLFVFILKSGFVKNINFYFENILVL